MEIPVFHTKKDLFDFLVKNKAALIAQKKCQIKHGDPLQNIPEAKLHDTTTKAEGDSQPGEIGKLAVTSVINTTGFMDSHYDVHIKGLWKKSLAEKKSLLLLKQHSQTFEAIISDEVKASAVSYNWKDLGFNYEGQTEALVFNSIVHADRNEYMFEQYKKGYVKNHSVGMQYVNLFMCINSEEKYYREEKENWDKYIKQVANKESAEEAGFFWAVTEAKVIEGSAVVFGSNSATPTLSVIESKGAGQTTPTDIEPDSSTQKEAAALKAEQDKKALFTNLI